MLSNLQGPEERTQNFVTFERDLYLQQPQKEGSVLNL